mgnify:CR=1 FL=1
MEASLDEFFASEGADRSDAPEDAGGLPGHNAALDGLDGEARRPQIPSLASRTRSPPWISGTRRGFFPSSYDSGPVSSDCLQIRERSSGPELFARKSIFLHFSQRYPSSPSPASKTFMFLGVAGGTIERSCYSPHYVNTERDYERDYQATLPQGRTAADGCKPRHGRGDRKRERSFSGLRSSRVALRVAR